MSSAIGVDIVRIARFANGAPQSRTRLFTENELAYAAKQHDEASSLAGIFAAKEASIKAMPSPWVGSLLDIEVAHEADGRPFIRLHGELAARLAQLESKLLLSISHDGDYAIAFVTRLATYQSSCKEGCLHG